MKASFEGYGGQIEVMNAGKKFVRIRLATKGSQSGTYVEVDLATAKALSAAIQSAAKGD